MKRRLGPAPFSHYEPTHHLTPDRLKRAFDGLSSAPIGEGDWLIIELAGPAALRDQDVREIAGWLRLSSFNDRLLADAAAYCLMDEPPPKEGMRSLILNQDKKLIEETGEQIEARRIRFTTIVRDGASKPVLLGRSCRLVRAGHLLLVLWESLDCFPRLPDDLSLLVSAFKEPDAELPSREELLETAGWWTHYDERYLRGLPTLNVGTYPTVADAAERYVLLSVMTQLDTTERMSQEVETAELALLATEDQRLPDAGIVDARADVLASIGIAAQLRRQLREVQEAVEDQDHLCWFIGASERGAEIQATVARAYELARSVAEDARDALAAMSSVATSKQLQLSHEAELKTSQLQEAITILGAVVLGPSLVAAIYGAEVALPGQHQWWGTALMFGLMVVVALAIYAWLSRLFPDVQPAKANVPDPAMNYLVPHRVNPSDEWKQEAVDEAADRATQEERGKGNVTCVYCDTPNRVPFEQQSRCENCGRALPIVVKPPKGEAGNRS